MMMMVMMMGAACCCCLSIAAPVLLYFVDQPFKDWINGLFGTSTPAETSSAPYVDTGTSGPTTPTTTNYKYDCKLSTDNTLVVNTGTKPNVKTAMSRCYATANCSTAPGGCWVTISNGPKGTTGTVNDLSGKLTPGKAWQCIQNSNAATVGAPFTATQYNTFAAKYPNNYADATYQCNAFDWSPCKNIVGGCLPKMV